MSETEKEALLIGPAIAGCVMLFNVCEKFRLSLEPRETEVRRERVERTDHVGIFQVPCVLVRHPFRVCELLADGASLALDSRLVTTQHLEADNILGLKLERCVRREAMRDASTIEIDDLLLLLLTRFLGEVFARLVWNQALHASICVFRNPDDLDVVLLRERLDKVLSRVKRPALLVCQYPLRVWDEVMVSLQQMLAYQLSIHSARGRQFLQPIFQDWGLPLLHEGQWASPSLAMLFELPEERLDVFLVFSVVGVDGTVSDDVRCGGDVAADGRLVLETKTDCIKVWRYTREMQQRIKLVVLRMVQRPKW